MSQPTKTDNRFYPPNTPENKHIRYVLDQLYSLHDAHEETKTALAQAQQQVKQLTQKLSTPYPAGSGPIDTIFLGLPVQPIDTNTLADGTVPKFNKKSGSFIVS